MFHNWVVLAHVCNVRCKINKEFNMRDKILCSSHKLISFLRSFNLIQTLFHIKEMHMCVSCHFKTANNTLVSNSKWKWRFIIYFIIYCGVPGPPCHSNFVLVCPTCQELQIINRLKGNGCPLSMLGRRLLMETPLPWHATIYNSINRVSIYQGELKLPPFT